MNQLSFPLLSLLIWLPCVSAVVILLLPGEQAKVALGAKWIAFWTSLFVFGLSILLWIGFDIHYSGFQFYETWKWIPASGLHYSVGVDGISVLFVLLTTFLTPICILASWENIRHRVREYMAAFLILETMILGAFCSLNFMFFYFFFEATLIPIYLIIGVWGGPDRVKATIKFFLYTLAGTVLLLLAILKLWSVTGTLSIPVLMHTHIPGYLQFWLFLAFLAAFAVKIPMWPVHSWLPGAYAEAPTAGTIILTAVMLKLGIYGFLRFSLPLLPEASHFFAPLMLALSAVAIVYAAFVAFAQTDIKKMLGYSSIAHMGMVTLGIFTFTFYGIEGGLFMMVSHGVIAAGLFLCAGVLIDRLQTRKIIDFGGLATRTPVYATIFMIMTLASIGLPGTSGFIGEFLIILGVIRVNLWLAIVSGLGLILSVMYMLHLYKDVVFGKITKEHIKAVLDISPRETALFVPLVIVIFWMGLYPTSFTRFFDASAMQLARITQVYRQYPSLGGGSIQGPATVSVSATALTEKTTVVKVITAKAGASSAGAAVLPGGGAEQNMTLQNQKAAQTAGSVAQ